MKNNVKILISIILCLGLVILANKNTQAYQWDKTFGGSGLDNGYNIKQMEDDGYLIAGSNGSVDPNGDVWVIKTDLEGNEEWNWTYGGSGGEGASYIQKTNDNGYIIIGVTNSYGAGDLDFWLLKIDSEGNEEWDNTFGGPELDICLSGLQTIDGGYILVGKTYSFGAGSYDIWLVKADSEGNEEWNKTFGTSYSEGGSDVIQLEDGNYIITGSEDWDVVLIKTDSEGNEIWTKTYDCYASFEGGCCVRQKEDGGFIIVGGTDYPYGSYQNILLISTNSDGNELWKKNFEMPAEYPPGGYSSYGCSVDITDDNGYFITGYVKYYHGGDIWIIKTDSEGNKQWDKMFGGEEIERAFCGIQTSDNGYIITGWTTSYGAGSSDVWLIYYSTDIPGVPLSRTEIMISTSILLLIAISPIFLKKKMNCNKYII